MRQTRHVFVQALGGRVNDPRVHKHRSRAARSLFEHHDWVNRALGGSATKHQCFHTHSLTQTHRCMHARTKGVRGSVIILQFGFHFFSAVFILCMCMRALARSRHTPAAGVCVRMQREGQGKLPAQFSGPTAILVPGVNNLGGERVRPLRAPPNNWVSGPRVWGTATDGVRRPPRSVPMNVTENATQPIVWFATGSFAANPRPTLAHPR